MTPQEFKTIWAGEQDNLIPVPPTLLAGLNLSPDTIDFLSQAGLPLDASPFLSFVDSFEGRYKGIARLTDQYDFLEEEFRKWIVIGSCSDGDPIAINPDRNDQIERLDHENYFEPDFFNCSVEALARCLGAYRDFVLKIQKENGENAYLDSDFTDAHFERLREDILTIDSKALDDNSFWKAQLDMDIAMREDNRSKRKS
jgi:hypothetical protein